MGNLYLPSTTDTMPHRFPMADGVMTGDERVDSRVTKRRWAFAARSGLVSASYTVVGRGNLLARSFSIVYCSVLEGMTEYTGAIFNSKLKNIAEQLHTWISVYSVCRPI